MRLGSGRRGDAALVPGSAEADNAVLRVRLSECPSLSLCLVLVAANGKQPMN
jgi:hypothetical protein